MNLVNEVHKKQKKQQNEKDSIKYYGTWGICAKQ